MTLLYVVAGEASGDVLGGRLVQALRARMPDLQLAGIGGPALAAAGLERSLFPIAELALMGLVEVIPKALAIRRRIAEVAADIAYRRPAAVLTIDSPGFALRLLRRIAPLGIPRVHYVAPQAWAWRESRVRSWPGLWERLLCLLPFEPAFFARHGIEARFVGHPVLESEAAGGNAARFRARHGLAADQRVLLLLPGSRLGEITRHMDVMGAAATRLTASRPDLQVVLAAAPGLQTAVAERARSWPVAPRIVTELADRYDAFAASTAALSKSGTSTLELAVARVPTVVMYRMHPITAAFVRRMVRVRYASIVNLLADAPLMPELFQEAATPAALASTLVPLLDDPAQADAQRAAVAPTLARLRPPGGLAPSAAAAAEIAALIRS